MEPQKKHDYDIEPEIRPDLRVIPGGGETTSDRPSKGQLSVVSNQQEDTRQHLHAIESGAGRQQVPSGDVREQESAPPIADHVNNFTGTQKVKGKFFTRKRVGIFGGVGAGLLGIIGLGFTFLGPASLLLNLGEVATTNLDSRDTILNRRLYKVLDQKMTNGSCGVVKVACRFSRPSNAMLSRLSDYGIKAVKADGTEIEKKPLGFPNENPARYEFTDSRGNTLSVEPKDFVKTLRSNPEFRSTFMKAYNMRYLGYGTKAIKKLFYKKNDIDRTGKTTDSIDKDKPADSIKKVASDADKDNPIRKAGDNPDSKNTAAKELISDAVTDEVKKTTKKAVKTGGDPVIVAGTIGCIAINAPGFVTNIVRLYQMRQEIALAATLVLTASSMLKAGDMSPETMATIGTLLTATTIASNGTSGKSAMDSFGMKSILFGDKSSSDPSYKKFIPGNNVMSLPGVKDVNVFANNPAMKTACEVVTSPTAQVVSGTIQAGISVGTGGVGAIALAALRAAIAGTAVVIGSDLFMKAMEEPIKQGVSGLLGLIGPDVIASLLGNPDIENASGEDLGNVLAAGTRLFFSNATLSTGGVPLLKDQVVAFNEEQQKTIANYAEQDRVGRSPFDISSPYTFLGSIVSNFYKSAYVANDVQQTALSSVAYLLKAPLNMFSNNTNALSSDMAEQCSHAAEFGVDESVAVGPFSDICAGIPAQYLDIPTSDVLTSVSDQIDDNTGEIKDDSDLGLANADCSTGSLLNAKGCAIDPSQSGSQERATRQLYNFDLEINNMLDGDEDPSAATTGSAADATFDMNALYEDSTNIACAAGTEDRGIDTAYNNGTPFQIRLCALPNSDERDGSTQSQPGIVNSRVSGAVYTMFEQMKKDLNLDKIPLGDSFRSPAEQQAQIDNCGLYDNGGCAAAQGYSNHQSGLAIDFEYDNTHCVHARGITSCPASPIWNWLQNNAATYGYRNGVDEWWHWSPTGG